MRIGTICALLAAGSAAAAQQPFNRTLNVSSPLSISVTGMQAEVIVIGWSRNQVEVSGTLPPGQRVEISREDRRVEVRVIAGRTGVRGGRLVVRVPRGNALDVETTTGAISADSVGGLARLKSAAGSVTVRGPARTLSLETISGAITVDAAAQGVVAHTAGGAVRIAGVSGFLEVFTGEGAVDVVRSRVTQATFTTLSGPIVFAADLEPNALVRFDSYVGAVELRLSPSVDASFELSTFGGTVVNELGPPARKSSDYAPGKELNFTRGPGSSRILIDTYGGDIRLLAR
jgi:hypothetical protein